MTATSSVEGWLRRPENPEEKRYEVFDDVWHYTNHVGLEGILRTNSVWASSHRSLNDTSEIEFGIAAVRRAWDQLRLDLIPEAPALEITSWLDEMALEAREYAFYFVSATEDGDSLSHWKYYGSGDGVAVRFDPQKELRAFDSKLSTVLFQPDYVPSPYWRRVQYGDFDPGWTQTVDNRIWMTIDAAVQSFGALKRGRVPDPEVMLNYLQRVYLTTVAFVKHGSFEQEDEVRVVAIGPPFPGFASERTGRFGLQTYMVLVTATEGDILHYSERTSSSLPITHVRIAPGDSSDSRAKFVRQLLDEHGYSQVAVAGSSVPFR